MKIEIYINGELKMTCYNELTVMMNVANYRKKYGEENVEVKRIN